MPHQHYYVLPPNRKEAGTELNSDLHPQKVYLHTRKLHYMIMLYCQRQEAQILKQMIQEPITYVSSRSSTNASTAELRKAAITVNEKRHGIRQSAC